MLKITGYSDQISVAPGDTIKFMVNCENDSYKAEIVRVVCGDVNPDGPGVKEPVFDSPVNKTYKGRPQQIYPGSYAKVESNGPLENLESFSVQAMIWPTTLGVAQHIDGTETKRGEQGIVTKWSDDTGGWALIVDENGSVALKVGDGKKTETVSVGKPMVSHEWYFAGASYNAKTKEVSAYQEAQVNYETVDDTDSVTKKVGLAPAPNKVPLVMAAWYKGQRPNGKGIICDGHYNGKIDSPILTGDVLSRAEMERLLGNGAVNTTLWAKVIGRWDFSADITDTTITDSSAHRLNGEIVNMPTRGVTGYNWHIDELCWRHAPQLYGAIKFHEDDVYDAGWEVDFDLTIPDDMKSGIYAAKLSSGDEIEYLPFAVRAKPGKENKICYVMPTCSYMAYANEHFATDPWALQLMSYRATELRPHHIFLNEHREYGMSLYDYHADASGVHISSRLRPILNMRPRVESALGGAGSHLWQFNADTHIIDWLESQGYDYDVITDEDMHYGGVDVLKPYSVILTGSHPEYYSKEMYDAVYEYTQEGGRLMYLGANGFYWRVSYHKTKPGVIEIRRAEGGSRAWAPKSGEYYTGFTGEYSGLWRRQGPTGPNTMAGVGFAAEGFDISTYYRQNGDRNNPRAKWIFEGIGEDELIGDFGLIGGGAAGLEVDRVDRGFGSPPHVLNLASSENHTDTYLQVVEDIFFNYPGTGGQENEFVRGDIVFYETPNGGAVFSASSIAWPGALSPNNYDNNVSRMTKNVLDRFVEPRAFA